MFTECLKFVASQYYLYPADVQKDPWYFTRPFIIDKFKKIVTAYRSEIKAFVFSKNSGSHKIIGIDNQDLYAMFMSDVWAV
jgi:hypothetical protein